MAYPVLRTPSSLEEFAQVREMGRATVLAILMMPFAAMLLKGSCLFSCVPGTLVMHGATSASCQHGRIFHGHQMQQNEPSLARSDRTSPLGGMLHTCPVYSFSSDIIVSAGVIVIRLQCGASIILYQSSHEIVSLQIRSRGRRKTAVLPMFCGTFFISIELK